MKGDFISPLTVLYISAQNWGRAHSPDGSAETQFPGIGVSCCGVVRPKACRKNEALDFMCRAMPRVTEMENHHTSFCQVQEMSIGVHPESVNSNFS